MFGAGITVWNSTFFDCQDRRTEIQLRHRRYDDVDSPPHADCNRGAVIAKSIGVICYTSQLIVTIWEVRQPSAQFKMKLKEVVLELAKNH